MNLLSSLVEVFKIKVRDGETMCDPECPQMQEGRCTRFSGTLAEQEIARDIFARCGDKVRWQACVDGTTEQFKRLKEYLRDR